MQLFNDIYQLVERLDQGASAEVWKCVDTLTNTTLALKIYSPTNDMGTNGFQMLAHEFKIMVNVNHRNLLKPLHFELFENHPFLVLPYCRHGNISKLKGTFIEKQAWTLLRDVAGGLAYLHDMRPPLIHQDIKPANILVADNGDFMLTDFGVSTYAKARINRSKEDRVLMSAGTVAYMPPEKFNVGSSPIKLGDIWSLGATVYEMLTSYLPFGNDGGMIQSQDSVIEPLPGAFSALLNHTVLSCLSYETWKRPSAQDLYEQAEEALKCIKKGKQLPLPPKPEPKQEMPPTTPLVPTSVQESQYKQSSVLEPIPIPEPIPESGSTPYNGDDSGKSTDYRIIAIIALVGLLIGVLIAYFI